MDEFTPSEELSAAFGALCKVTANVCDNLYVTIYSATDRMEELGVKIPAETRKDIHLMVVQADDFKNNMREMMNAAYHAMYDWENYQAAQYAD